MTELGFDDRNTSFSTNNITLFATTFTPPVTSPIIGNLEVTVTGTGAPVMVEFYAPGVWNNYPSAVTAYFVVTVNGGTPVVTAALSQYRNYAATLGEGGVMRRRLVLTNGSTYKFQVGLNGYGGGITTVTAGNTDAGVIYLRVTD